MNIPFLKPCPFCQGFAIESDVWGEYDNSHWLEIRCSNCEAKMEEYPKERLLNYKGEFNITPEEASIFWENSKQTLRNRWNNRKPNI